MSIKLVHTFGRNAGSVQSFDKPVVRCGRAPDGDVVFDAEFDRDASGNHAEIRREAGGWSVVDLRSRNGTFVNGERVERRALSTGDEITFGAKGPRVRVEIGVADAPRAGAPPAAAGGTQPAEPSIMAFSGAAPGQPAPSAHAPHPPAVDTERPPGWRASRGLPAGQLAGQVGGHPQTPGAPQAAPPAGQRVGQKTIAALISSAVASARAEQPKKMDTRVLAAYVDRQVGAATAGQRRTTAVLAGLLVVALVGIGGLVVWSQWSSDDIESLRKELANLPPNDPRREKIENRLGQLHPPKASFGRSLYDQSKKGIFMLAAGGQGFCTAFAVRPSVLATNAHCVVAAQRAGGNIVALENEGRGQTKFDVVDLHAHPGYRDNDANALTPDVGIVNISGKAAVVLTMAPADELSALGAGDDVGLIGFPGRLMDTANPVATFLGAHVGRVTTPKGRAGAFNDTWLVQHDAPTTHGTSGSPIFNNKGHVVAINSGGYLEGDQETVAGRKTEVVKASPYKFGMRIDLVNGLLH